MTVNSTVIKDQYNCNGVLTSFAFTFKAWQTSEVKVILRDSTGAETVLTETVHYTVTINSPTPNTGQIDTVATYAAGNTLTLVETLPLSQLVDWGEGDRFPAASHEEAADRAAIKDQQMQEKFSRALLLPASTALADLEFPEPEALKYPRWNAGATALENADLVALGDLAAHAADVTAPHEDWENVTPHMRNFVINGCGRINQRVTAGDLSGVATGVEVAGADRWKGLWNGTACTSGNFSGGSVASFLSGHCVFASALTLTGAGVLYFLTRIESKDAKELYQAGSTTLVSLQFKVYHDVGVGKILNTFVYKANAEDNFAAVTLVATSSATIPDSYTTHVKIEGLNLGDVRNGIQLYFQFICGAVTNKLVYLSDVQLERNTVCSEFERRPFATELALCQRYYQKSYDYAIAPGAATNEGKEIWYCSLLANAASVHYLGAKFRTQMRSDPTVTLWDAAGVSGNAETPVGTGVAGTVSNINNTGFMVNATQGAGTTKGLAFQWRADAEF